MNFDLSTLKNWAEIFILWAFQLLPFLIIVAIWVGKKYLESKISKSVDHNFSINLSKINSEFRNNEEIIKSLLRDNENILSTVRSESFNAIFGRIAIVDQRTINSVERLWNEVLRLSQAKGISLQISMLNFDAAAKIAKNDPNAREKFKKMGGEYDNTIISSKDAELARPYISESLWATYSAYRTIISLGIVKWHILYGGLEHTGFINFENIHKLIYEIFPDRNDLTDINKTDVLTRLYEELENKLLNEIRSILQGEKSDEEKIKKAINIVSLANTSSREIQNIEKPPITLESIHN